MKSTAWRKSSILVAWFIEWILETRNHARAQMDTVFQDLYAHTGYVACKCCAILFRSATPQGLRHQHEELQEEPESHPHQPAIVLRMGMTTTHKHCARHSTPGQCQHQTLGRKCCCSWGRKTYPSSDQTPAWQLWECESGGSWRSSEMVRSGPLRSTSS